jgi:hypothetical protein
MCECMGTVHKSMPLESGNNGPDSIFPVPHLAMSYGVCEERPLSQFSRDGTINGIRFGVPRYRDVYDVCTCVIQD